MAIRMLPRRTLLRGLLGGAAVSLGLPLLDMHLNNNGTALASGSPLPRRFGLFFWGNGVLETGWTPEGDGKDWKPSKVLAPLADLHDEITVVSGMKVYTGNTVPHGSGPAGLLSGASLLKEDTDSFAAASLDQIIASAIGGETRFRSLEVGIQKTDKCMSFNGPYSMNPPECSPRALYERLFVDGFVAPGSGPKIDPRLALRRSILDAVSDDAKRLQGRLGAADKIRLEQHFEGLRSLELQLKKLEENPPNLAACKAPADPGEDPGDIEGRPQLAATCRAMGKLLAMALACDQTRVFSLWFSRPVSNLLYPTASAGHHQLTHDEADPQPQVFEILQYILGELNLFLKEFAAIQEGDGTLLDHSAILCTTDCSYARAHSVENYPILIAGSAGGALRKGIHYRSVSNENTSKVSLSLARAMGVNLASFGKDAGMVTDGLGAIEVG
ncbi:MAG: DUF1552 domain-containing protein [Polyangiaceae bacterium]|nr:DUF1552 domain-containing protein [Polyangiaceae bacterium]